MESARLTRELVLKYFHSWRDPVDSRAFRSCLSDDVLFDNGQASVSGADELTRRVGATASPWKDVVLLASTFEDSQAALFYEGTERGSGKRVRVAEHVAVENGRIKEIRAAVSPADPPPLESPRGPTPPSPQ
jgi:hypothetical protein